MSDRPPYRVDPTTRVEALQSALEVYAVRFKEQADRIEALEAALRACVQYHVKAAADCRAIAAVNRHNDLGEDGLTAAIDHDIAAEDIGDIARAALAEKQDK